MPKLMKTWSKRILLIWGSLFLFAFLGMAGSVFGQQNRQTELGFRNDNDAYLMIKQDQYYTNGIHFFIRKAVDTSRLRHRWRKKIWSLSLGQKIFNAYKGDIRDIREIDRPITGYLFAEARLNWYTDTEEIFGLGAELATIGPSAMGERVQRRFHDTFGFYEVNGWDYQLQNALGLDLHASYTRLLFRPGKSFDISTHSTASLGLNHSFAGTGLGVRLGKLNRLSESAFTGSRAGTGKGGSEHELFLFYSPQIRWTAYNSTIQGGMLVKDKGPVTFEIEPWVFGNVIGVQYAGRKICLNYSYVFNTREVKSNAGFQQFGSLSLSYFL
jgi:lipid A 3-O-deacylase